MELTKLIFDYWKVWMTVPVRINLWSLDADREGLGFYDWYIMTFWYSLNYSWYKINNKKYAYTGCDEPFEEPRDFEDFYA